MRNDSIIHWREAVGALPCGRLSYDVTMRHNRTHRAAVVWARAQQGLTLDGPVRWPVQQREEVCRD